MITKPNLFSKEAIEKRYSQKAAYYDFAMGFEDILGLGKLRKKVVSKAKG